MLVNFVSIFLSIVMFFGSFLGFLTGDKQGKIAHAEDNCIMSFAAISDTHIKDNGIRGGMLELGLKDFAAATDRLDAVLFDGDITDDGLSEQWARFSDCLVKYNFTDNIVLAIGNHDTRGPIEDDYESTRVNFCNYNKSIAGRTIDKVYYSTIVKGCYMIVLGSEHDGTAATISQEQIDWFAAEMEKASATGMPIFVFLHQPINDTHGLPLTWEMDESDPPGEGGIGERSDDILAIIKQYKNVFYISGHIHAGFSTEDDGTVYSSVEKHEGYTLINLPSYMYMDVKRGGNITNGTGYVLEVYAGKVMIRARNFATGTWCTKYDVTVDLV